MYYGLREIKNLNYKMKIKKKYLKIPKSNERK